MNQFFTDAQAGKLPPISYIDPFFYGNDDHPPIHPINGQELIASIYTALAQSPQWKNILFVVTYDECGGFYDHVSPPTTADDLAAQGFNQLGFRVPAMVMGPYAKQGYISSVQYDHTSALKHLTNVFGLESLNMRVDAANDLTDCIDMDRLTKNQPAAPIDLPTVDTSQFPMPPECTYSGDAMPAFDPISEVANLYPERVARWDARRDRDAYRKGIRDFLSQAQKR